MGDVSIVVVQWVMVWVGSIRALRSVDVGVMRCFTHHPFPSLMKAFEGCGPVEEAL